VVPFASLGAELVKAALLGTRLPLTERCAFDGR